MKGVHTSLNFLAVLVIVLFSFSNSYSSDLAWKIASEGNKIIMIRHSKAPGYGDPDGFNLKDCKTQRNLSNEGIEQSKRIGKLFKQNKILIDKVFSSEWCRCKDTAYYAFNKYEIFKGLNSTFTPPYNKNEIKQIKQIKQLVSDWNSKNKNLVFVTHYSVITAITTAVPSSGEIVITDRNFEVLGKIKTK